MAFGSSSAIFQQAALNPILGRLWTTAAPTTFSSLSADTVNAALFNNTTTPDKTAAVASTGFNTGVWVTGNEVTDATNWTSGGRPLASKAFSIDTGSSSICFQAAATAGAGNVTIANAYGCLVYDNTITAGTVAKQAMCYNSFGGSAQGVTAGTFTILWATVGALTNVVVFNVTV
jgi:hypothetical protein